MKDKDRRLAMRAPSPLSQPLASRLRSPFSTNRRRLAENRKKTYIDPRTNGVTVKSQVSSVAAQASIPVSGNWRSVSSGNENGTVDPRR